MRKKREKQRPLSPQWPDHQLAQELKLISRILDDNPQTLELIVQDLSDRVDSSVGAPGLTAEQVLRCAVIKQLHQFSYRKLEFHLVDSQSCQSCRLPYGASISKATLAENLGKRPLGALGAARGLEKGQRIRVDATGSSLDQQSHCLGVENLGKIEPTTWKAINDHLVLSSRLNDRPSGPVCSVFEEHTDILKKSPRETVWPQGVC